MRNLLTTPSLILIAASATTLGRAQVWTSVGGAPARALAAMAFDDARGVAIQVGGMDAQGLITPSTVEWNGSQWQTVSSGGPSNRRSGAMAYDPVAGQSVLFGGVPYATDTWAWDGAAWTQVALSGPSQRQGAAMVYDSARQRVLLFGGHDYSGGPGIPLGDTWAWSGGVWAQVDNNGPARGEHAMAYDMVRDRVVVFGGNLPFPASLMLGDTWEWDGATWSQVASSGPGARCCTAMTFHVGRSRSLLYGGWDGRTRFGDTWEWDGASWVQPQTLGPTPYGRYGHGMVYDRSRDRAIVGGSIFSQNQDTWEYGLAASFEPFGSGCPGSLVVPTSCQEQNPAGGALAAFVTPNEFAITVGSPLQTLDVSAFEIYSRSTTGSPETVTARVYSYQGQTPLASTTLTVGATSGWYRATLPSSLTLTGFHFIAIDASAQNVYVPAVASGVRSATFTRPPSGGAWTPLPTLSPMQVVAWRLLCPQSPAPAIDHVGLPKVGATFQATLSRTPPSSGAFLVAGLSNTQWNGQPLPAPLPNAPGCQLLIASDVTLFTITDPTGSASVPVSIPNSTSYAGLQLFHQWLVLDNVNPLGAIVSDAAKVVVGR